MTPNTAVITHRRSLTSSRSAWSPTPIIRGEVAFAALMHWRQQQIARAAYFKSQARGFAPGHELEDWLAAEFEIDEASRPR